MQNTHQYTHPETGEVVEATQHEYAIRLKKMGFVLVNPNNVRSLRPEDVVTNDENAGKPQQTKITTEKPLTVQDTPRVIEEKENARRVKAEKDDLRG